MPRSQQGLQQTRLALNRSLPSRVSANTLGELTSPSQRRKPRLKAQLLAPGLPPTCIPLGPPVSWAGPQGALDEQRPERNIPDFLLSVCVEVSEIPLGCPFSVLASPPYLSIQS